jgi:FkbM family methyltransferase
MNLPRLIRRHLRDRSAPDRDSGLTEEHVIWAYRLMLDRDPESSEVIQQKLATWSTVPQLRRDLLSSVEFRTKQADLGYSNDPLVVIKEIDDAGLRLFVDLSDTVVGLNIAKGEYERSELEYVRRTVTRGQHVLDVGAHMGVYTIVMAALVGAEGEVHAFEPHARIADLVRRSIRENAFEDRVVLHEAAVGEKEGKIDLVVLPKALNSGGSYRLHDGGGVPGGHRTERVRLVALDQCRLSRPIHFMKVDVEGSEPFVFRGAKRILTEDRPAILCELHRAQLERVAERTPRVVIREMGELGYECRALDAGNPGAPVGDVEAIASVVFLPRS